MGQERGTEWPKVGITGQILTSSSSSPLITPVQSGHAAEPPPYLDSRHWRRSSNRAACPASHKHSTSLILTYRYLHPPTELRPRTNVPKRQTLTGKHQISAHFPPTLAGMAEWAQTWGGKDRDGSMVRDRQRKKKTCSKDCIILPSFSYHFGLGSAVCM